MNRIVKQVFNRLPAYGWLALGGALLAAAANTPAPAPAPSVKIAVLDTDRLRADSASIKAELLKASGPARAIQEQLKAKQDALKQAAEQYQAQKSAVAPEVNKQRLEALNKQNREAEALTKQLDEALGKAEQENLGPMRDRIRQVIRQVADERGIEIVLSAGEAVYYADKTDLTDVVIRRLDGAAKQ